MILIQVELSDSANSPQVVVTVLGRKKVIPTIFILQTEEVHIGVHADEHKTNYCL